MDSRVEIARAGGAATGIIMYGLTLNEWVAAITLVYLTLQIIILAPKAFKIIRGWLGFE